MAIPIQHKGKWRDYMTFNQASDAVVILKKRLKRKRKQLRECRAEKHALELRVSVLEERYGPKK